MSFEIDHSAWVGSFQSKQEAERALMARGYDLFSLDDWQTREAERYTVTLQNLAEGNVHGPRPSTLPEACEGTPGRTIVDFGGGSGWVFFVLEGLGLEPEMFVNIELPAVVRYFQHHVDSRIHFRESASLDSDPDLPPIDILYTNSTLQYLKDNTEFIRVARCLRPRLVLVDELLWSSGAEDWFAIQKNSAVPIIARFSSLTKLEGEMRSAGFRTTSVSPFGVGKHPSYKFPKMENYPPSLKISHAKSILFSNLESGPEILQPKIELKRKRS